MTSVRPHQTPHTTSPSTFCAGTSSSKQVLIIFILVVEERPDVQRVRGFLFSVESLSLKLVVHTQALTRLTPREAYDRAYRFKRASQASVLHKDLPKSEWVNPEEVWPHEHPSITTTDFFVILT